MTLEKLHQDIFMYQPHEVIGVVFDYFSAVLKDAPQEKIDEFFIYFREGVLNAIKDRKA